MKLGFTPKQYRVAVIKVGTPAERDFIAYVCTILQYEMLKFNKTAPVKKQQLDCSLSVASA